MTDQPLPEPQESLGASWIVSAGLKYLRLDLPMKIWNSKYALTKGLLEHDVEEFEKVGGSGYWMAYVGNGMVLHGEGREWHQTRASAAAKAESMRALKIASLKKQIQRLEGLRF